jgi:acetate---CoA ligase (ADP-forming)
VLAYVSPYAPIAASLLTASGVPAFTQPEACASVLSAMWHITRLPAPKLHPVPDTGFVMPDDDLPHGTLDEAQAKDLFARFGMQSVIETIVSTEAEATDAANELARERGDRLVLKVLSTCGS